MGPAARPCDGAPKRLAALGPQQLVVDGTRCVGTPATIPPRKAMRPVSRPRGPMSPWPPMRARRCTRLGSIHASYFHAWFPSNPLAVARLLGGVAGMSKCMRPNRPIRTDPGRPEKRQIFAVPSCWRVTGWPNPPAHRAVLIATAQPWDGEMRERSRPPPARPGRARARPADAAKNPATWRLPWQSTAPRTRWWWWIASRCG